MRIEIRCAQDGRYAVKSFSYKMRRLSVVMHVPPSRRCLFRERENSLFVFERCTVMLRDELSHQAKIRGFLPLKNRLPVLLQLSVCFFHGCVLIFDDIDMAKSLNMLGGSLVFATGWFSRGLGQATPALFQVTRRFFDILFSINYFFLLRLFFFGLSPEADRL